MQTERQSPRYSGIDLWDASDILDALVEGQFAAVAAVRAAQPQIERAAEAMEVRLKGRGRLIFVGAGTSGRLAIQDGAELVPTFSWPRERLLLLIAGGDEALIHAVEGAEDDGEKAAELVRNHAAGRDDVMIAVAASGTTPFTVAALRAAKAAAALTVAIANNAGTPLLEEADHGIFLDTGSEPIAGSTRMKAGTAQRIALGCLSSLLMIKLGRVYDGLMVDVKATNRKLIRRAENMLVSLSGQSQEDAKAALQRADGSVKLALLLLKGYKTNAAKTALVATNGNLRAALAALTAEPD